VKRGWGRDQQLGRTRHRDRAGSTGKAGLSESGRSVAFHLPIRVPLRLMLPIATMMLWSAWANTPSDSGSVITNMLECRGSELCSQEFFSYFFMFSHICSVT
jgi:hypothetical protein